MTYSSYTIDQLMNNNTYKDLCNCFLNLAKDPETRSLIEKILFDGGIDNYSVSTNLRRKDNPSIEGIRRISIAHLILTSPETFKYIKENNINVFHGTNAHALPGISKYGLSSLRNAKQNDIDITTGEEWSRMITTRPFVSFSDVLEVADYYAEAFPNRTTQDLSFGVIIGTTEEDIKSEKVVTILSDISEIGIKDQFPLDKIKCILVPQGKRTLVERILNNENIKVLEFDTRTKFYSMEYPQSVKYYPDIYIKYLNGEPIPKSEIDLTDEQLEEVAKTRPLSRITNIIQKIKNVFQENEVQPSGKYK